MNIFLQRLDAEHITWSTMSPSWVRYAPNVTFSYYLREMTDLADIDQVFTNIFFKITLIKILIKIMIQIWKTQVTCKLLSTKCVFSSVDIEDNLLVILSAAHWPTPISEGTFTDCKYFTYLQHIKCHVYSFVSLCAIGCVWVLSSKYIQHDCVCKLVNNKYVMCVCALARVCVWGMRGCLSAGVDAKLCRSTLPN